MAKTTCPVCHSYAEAIGNRDYGERRQIRCPICGPFVITGTAAAMLEHRFSNDPYAAVRVSHALRSMTSEKKWFEINSTEVERLTTFPLPSASGQLENLLNWVRQETVGGELSSVSLPSAEMLSTIVGATHPEHVKRLIEFAQKDERLELSSDGKSIRLGRRALQPAAVHHPLTKKNTIVAETKFEKGHCPDCGPDRSSDIVASHRENWAHETIPIWFQDYYMILKCRGCGSIYIKHAHYFSENEDYESHIEPEVTYWPAPSRRPRPNGWMSCRTVLSSSS